MQPVPETELRLSVSDIAKLFDVTDRTISNWAAEGMPHIRIKNKVNRYPWRPCLEWWLANRYAGQTKTANRGTPSKAESEAKLYEVKAAREQMRLEQDRGLLVPIADIEPAWVQAAGIVKDRIMGLNVTIKLAIPALTQDDLAKIRKICQDALTAIEQCPTQSKD